MTHNIIPLAIHDNSTNMVVNHLISIVDDAISLGRELHIFMRSLLEAHPLSEFNHIAADVFLQKIYSHKIPLTAPVSCMDAGGLFEFFLKEFYVMFPSTHLNRLLS